MDCTKYFASVFEFSNLVRKYHSAPKADKAKCLNALRNCTYLQELNKSQSITLADYPSEGIMSPQINKLKHDFFINMAVPGPEQVDDTAIEHMPYHRHNYLEMIFILRGHYAQYINGVRHEHHAGEVCLLNPNIIHRDSVAAAQDIAIYCCLGQDFVRNDLAKAFSNRVELNDFLRYRLGSSSVQYVLFKPQDFSAVENLLEKIVEENQNKLPGNHFVIKGYLVRMFSLLVHFGNYTVSTKNPNDAQEHLIAEILQYIQQHIADMSRENVAHYFHFNADYLNRMLTQATGSGYTAHVQEIRLREAAKRLQESSDSVNAILQELGIQNKSYFNRLFQARYGVLPGEYRKL